MVTVSLAKGRIGKKAIERFNEIGIVVDMDNSRKLCFEDSSGEYQFILTKADDVCTYVEYGVADIGIVGKDSILEQKPDIYEVLDLGYAKCRMCLCGKQGESLPGGIVKVASKYPNIAADYFTNVLGRHAEIIKLHGSVELAPLMGLSDCIVDIVESGKTLVENGMCVMDEICELTARLVVNHVSMRVKHEQIKNIIERFVDYDNISGN